MSSMNMNINETLMRSTKMKWDPNEIHEDDMRP